MQDAVNEFVIEESGVTITITVTVSDEGDSPNDRRRVEYYGEEIINKLFVRAVKKFTPRRVRLTKIHERMGDF